MLSVSPIGSHSVPARRVPRVRLGGTAMDDSATDALFCFPSLFVHQATLFLVLDVRGDPSCVPCRDDKISCPLMEEFVLFLYCDLVDITGDAPSI